MSHIRYSQIPITEMVFALPTDYWQVRLVPGDEIHGSPVKSHFYTKHQLLNAVGYFRHENRVGYHVYGRPNTNRHILVDDLNQDALNQMTADGLRQNVAVRTSPDNYQAWITISEDEVSPRLAVATAKYLAWLYAGDPGSTDAQHLGRLPGFTNQKYEHWTGIWYPFTGLHGPIRRGTSLGAPQLLADAEEHSNSLPPSSPVGACVPTNSNIDIDPSRSPMTADEAHELYDEELEYQAGRKGWKLPIQKGLRSQADYAVIYHLRHQYGYDPDDLAALLKFESEKAAERGMGYVIRTVNAAF